MDKNSFVRAVNTGESARQHQELCRGFSAVTISFHKRMAAKSDTDHL
jgi:hypothetical protein